MNFIQNENMNAHTNCMKFRQITFPKKIKINAEGLLSNVQRNAIILGDIDNDQVFFIY